MPVQFSDLKNICDANVYMDAAYGFGFGQWRKVDIHLDAENLEPAPSLERCNLAQWQEKGWDLHSTTLQGVLVIDTEKWILSWESAQSLPVLPKPADADSTGVAVRWCLPGPFSELQETRSEIKLIG